MNGSIVKYFAGPGADDQKRINPKLHESPDGAGRKKDADGCHDASSVRESGSASHCSYKSEVDRMITENMTSVLKSLKKKRNHKCSKRKRNGDHDKEKEECSQESEIITVVEVVPEKDNRRRSPRKMSQEKSRVEGSKVTEQEQQKEENKKVNAFQLLMSSRNKAIGSNSPGKDAQSEAVPDEAEIQKRNELAKRKLKLEEWADRKGAGKRKLQEAEQEEFIAHQMNRRAKRLKRLVKNMEMEEAPEEMVDSKEPSRRNSKRVQKATVEEVSPQGGSKVELKRGRTRLTSGSSTQSSSTNVTEDATEKSPTKALLTDEFMHKLSSPLKKRDSLLGYFNKVEKSSPSPELEEKPLRRRGRAKKSKEEFVEALIIVEDECEKPDENENSLNTSTSGRPRRSCAGKIKDYAIFSGTSPENSTKRGAEKKPIVTPLKIINMNSPQTLQVVRSPSVRRLSKDLDAPGTPKSSQNLKLAPLFVKKPLPDPEKVRARHEFLMSGIPDKMRQEIEKQRVFEESILNESPVFPLISHIQQLASPKTAKKTSFRGNKIRISSKPSNEVLDVPNEEEEFAFSSLTDCDDTIVEDLLAQLIDRGNPDEIYSYVLPELPHVKSIVRDWKQTYKHFPVFKCYKQYRAMYEEHTEEGSPPRKSNFIAEIEDSIEFVEEKFSALNGDLLFTEKYKPQISEHILINCQPAVALKKFLSSWKEDRSSNPYDPGDDFENSNSSVSSSSNQSLCNHIVLIGPSGSGKTCNVYAVANEMNFNVLELNASSRRKGKIILQELQEATQSHQVRGKDETVDIFRKALSQKGAKTKARKPSTDSDGGSKKLSLILIEDADIVFDQDEGFVAAINQLISTSKRPIVLTTTDPNCGHLARYVANNVIRFVAPGIAHVSKLLSILALVERVHLDQYDLARLYALNRKDLRKTINELQFFIQSGGDRCPKNATPVLMEEADIKIRDDNVPVSMLDDEASRQSNGSSNGMDASVARLHRSLFRLFSRNQNEVRLIRAPLNFDNLWCNMERVLRTERPQPSGAKRKKAKPKDRELQKLEELVFFYGNVSSAVLIQRDSKTVQDRLVDHLEEEIAHNLVESSWEQWFDEELNPKAKSKRRSGVGAMCYDSLKQIDVEERRTISSYIGVNTLNTRSTYCDYEPHLRTICRYERERSRQERRGSRFYHYFRNFVNYNPPAVGSATVSNFSMDHFDELSTHFEENHIPATKIATTSSDLSDGSR
ncbi:enhanced level of genomic instability 1 [Toxorhynchites rutilus septentrionalis]|uniref:enhanced level of genomic instability 1 n=1 Tax=Toxorhynchites rutilus septentrionalis TaxID=329112 RepID=UPI002478E22A|nr:enhanced level of genomic instability 1 [Toxorhynchites rutilus septentrionalis]